jgi:hypothetical protein
MLCIDLSRKVVLNTSTPPSLCAVNPLGIDVVRIRDPFGAYTFITAFIVSLSIDSSLIVYCTPTLTWFASVFVRGTKLELLTEIDILSLFCANDCVTLVSGKKLKHDRAMTKRTIDFGEWDIIAI